MLLVLSEESAFWMLSYFCEEVRPVAMGCPYGSGFLLSL
jgi:hypothetical protein